MKCFLGIFLLSGAASSYALDHTPWFGSLAEQTADFEYQYAHYQGIANDRFCHAFSDHQLRVSTGAYFSNPLNSSAGPTYQFEIEGEFARSDFNRGYFRSLAIQSRRLLLNDVAEDLPFSFVVGLEGRYLPRAALSDPSTPYQGTGSFELGASIGREFSSGSDWRWRPFGYVSAGVDTDGEGFGRGEVTLWAQTAGGTQGELFMKSYYAFSGKRDLHQHFSGWSGIQHRSVDVGGVMRFKLSLWGFLALKYTHRVHAVAFPKGMNAIELSYTLPFSLLF